MRSIAAIALVASACSVAGAGDDRVALRDRARLVLEAHCGLCHIGTEPTAVPRALAVYDLTEANWPARMTDAQLRSALDRLANPVERDPFADASSSDVAVFRRFVEAETRARIIGPR